MSHRGAEDSAAPPTPPRAGNLMSSSAEALQHAARGRAIVGRIPHASPLEPRLPHRVSIVGGGLMGTGIALALLNADLPVTVVEMRAEARDKLRATVRSAIDRDVEKQRISQHQGTQREAALSVVESLEGAREAELFIEAIVEDLSAKREVFQALDRWAPAEALLASNTSTLDIDAIARATSRPERVVGLHFFSPANIMRLVEIVRGNATSAQSLTDALAFVARIRKSGVVAGNCDGFIGNRIFEEYLRQVWFLLEEGALPQQIDAALEAFGMAMGHCRVMDLAGQDIGWKSRQRRAIEQANRPYSRIPDLVCELKRFGQKTGAGFYRYPDGRTPQTDPVIEKLIVEESRRISVTRRSIEDQEIVERCVSVMINEASRILGEGIAYRPIDIDVVYLDGYGFPPERGGPMFYADELGAAELLSTLRRRVTQRHGWAFEPAPLLEDLAAHRGRFADLNR